MNSLDYHHIKHKIALIGKVLRPHGTKGEVKVLPYSNSPEDLFKLETKEFFLLIHREERVIKTTLEANRPLKNIILFKFKEFNSLAELAPLKGAEIGVQPEARWGLPEDHYYHDQLIGLDVVDVNSAESLGVIKDIVYGGGNDLLALDYEGKEVLIPAAKGCIVEVNLAQGYVKVNLPEGLLDIF